MLPNPESSCGFGLRHLNYNHLHYFWVIAATGSIARAAESLHVTPQTISGQIRSLEARLGSRLFRRDGRKCELTEMGQMVHSYVDPMFSLGWELGEVLEKRAPRRPSPLSIGIATGVGKLIASRMLGPALSWSASARVLCREAPSESLVSALLAQEIDLAVTDSTLSPAHSARVRSHIVGECGVTFFCATGQAERYRARFPESLDGAPFVMPGRTSMLAKSLAKWFHSQRIAPAIVAEIESPDLASVICETHTTLFALPTTIAHEVERKSRVAAIGEAPGVEQRFYLISAVRPTPHESIPRIIDSVRQQFRMPATGSALERVLDSWRLGRKLPQLTTAPESDPHAEECAI